MEAGRLRHRINVQAPVETPAVDSGDPEVTWTDVGTCWGMVEPLRGREATYAGQQILAEMDTRITVRYSELTAQITAAHRLEHQGNLFNIVSVAQVNLAQRAIEMMCKSGVNDG